MFRDFFFLSNLAPFWLNQSGPKPSSPPVHLPGSLPHYALRISHIIVMIAFVISSHVYFRFGAPISQELYYFPFVFQYEIYSTISLNGDQV